MFTDPSPKISIQLEIKDWQWVIDPDQSGPRLLSIAAGSRLTHRSDMPNGAPNSLNTNCFRSSVFRFALYRVSRELLIPSQKGG